MGPHWCFEKSKISIFWKKRQKMIFQKTTGDPFLKRFQQKLVGDPAQTSKRDPLIFRNIDCTIPEI